MQAQRVTREIEYPQSDGKPMAESDLHRDWIFCVIERLKRFYAGQRVYVSGNLLIYYEEGNLKKCVAPDTFVVKDCEMRQRRIFKIWEERRIPNWLLETTSKKTRREDRGKKKVIYALLGVPEYYLYDPQTEWLDPPLQGFTLVDGTYQPIPPDATGGIPSEELGITFRIEDGRLEMYQTATGKRLLDHSEAAAEAQELARAAQEKAAEAEAARKALEEELARLRAHKGE